MQRNKKFELLEHTADVYIAAYGRTLEEAFENAALATFEVMTDTADVKPETFETLEVKGFDERALLYNWIEELLVRFETTGNLYSRFKIHKIERKKYGLRLRADIQGEEFSPNRHMQRVGIKAVTYHRMDIEEEAGKATVRLVLDI